MYSLQALEQIEAIEKRLLDANLNFCTKFISPKPGADNVCKIELTDDIAPEGTKYSLLMVPSTPYTVQAQLLIRYPGTNEISMYKEDKLEKIIVYLKQRKAFA
ncbi:hypothetical protein [Vibrio owensii]|uniref:hypothetical protein n=1 Tax=Vibrio owensii TaxID=696485 RepID=UPI0018F20A1D|nr:hypothetical protein [Vibrio owensii]